MSGPIDLSARLSGVLLHPTSLPGPYGRGDIGAEARRFVDWLAAAGQRVWQALPLGPPGYGGSPYASTSAFAGDTGLIDLEPLEAAGWLEAADLADAPDLPGGRVDSAGEGWRRERLVRAAQRFLADASPAERAPLAAFRAAERGWLDDHAVFVALKEAHGGGAYWDWPEPERRHLPPAVRAARVEHAAAIAVEEVLQHWFAAQWGALRAYARARGVEVVGDLPIFVARDSSDVWAHPELFALDAAGEPTVVAGVPPDAFSDDGQLWGNPLYDWTIHARTGYAWWIERLRHELSRSGLVRIDHFRGFASYWEVPADAETAKEGRWVDGPRMELFGALRRALGEVPVIAEDLGHVTDDVTELLESTGFPGMRILQFAYDDDDPQHPFRPDQHPRASVVYTGTHDNQTTAGWWADLDDATRARVTATLSDPEQPVWSLIEQALGSDAFLAIIPAQDLLGLDDAARMNSPGKSDGNWAWRLSAPLDDALAERLRDATARHGRAPAA